MSRSNKTGEMRFAALAWRSSSRFSRLPAFILMPSTLDLRLVEHLVFDMLLAAIPLDFEHGSYVAYPTELIRADFVPISVHGAHVLQTWCFVQPHRKPCTDHRYDNRCQCSDVQPRIRRTVPTVKVQ